MQQRDTVLCFALLSAALAVAPSVPCAAGEPILGTNECLHLQTALRWLNMTTNDLGFTRDIGEPRLTLGWIRDTLGPHPLALPARADAILAAA